LLNSRSRKDRRPSAADRSGPNSGSGVGTLRWWDVKSGRCLQTLKGERTGGVLSVALSGGAGAVYARHSLSGCLAAALGAARSERRPEGGG